MPFNSSKLYHFWLYKHTFIPLFKKFYLIHLAIFPNLANLARFEMLISQSREIHKMRDLSNHIPDHNANDCQGSLLLLIFLVILNICFGTSFVTLKNLHLKKKLCKFSVVFQVIALSFGIPLGYTILVVIINISIGFALPFCFTISDNTDKTSGK